MTVAEQFLNKLYQYLPFVVGTIIAAFLIWILIILTQHYTSKGMEKYLPVIAKDKIYLQRRTIARQAQEIKNLKKELNSARVFIKTIKEIIP